MFLLTVPELFFVDLFGLSLPWCLVCVAESCGHQL